MTPPREDQDIAPGWQLVGDPADICAAWVAALGELDDVARTRIADAGSFSYKFASLDAVLGQARGVLAKHELCLFQVAQVVDGDICVSTTVMHSSGAWLVFAPFTLPAGNTAQSTGSSVTYSRRYALMAVLGLAAGDDDDGAAAGSRAPHADPAVIETFNALSAQPTDVQAELRRLAREHGRKLSQAALAADPEWLATVRDVIERDREPNPPTGATSALLANRNQLAALDNAERHAELGLARIAVVSAAIGRYVDDNRRLSRHEADVLLDVYDGIDTGRISLVWQSDGTVELVPGTPAPAADSSPTESGEG